MTGQRLDFDSPDETRTHAKTQVDLVRVGNTKVGRFAFAPGWRWSQCIKPVVGTESCQARHVGIVQSGSMHVAHDDGTETDLNAGAAYVIEPRATCARTATPAPVPFPVRACRSARRRARGTGG